jgi:hypothetical protein
VWRCSGLRVWVFGGCGNGRVASGRASTFAGARAYWWFMVRLSGLVGCVMRFWRLRCGVLRVKLGCFAIFLQAETLILRRFQGKVHAMSFFC